MSDGGLLSGGLNAQGVNVRGVIVWGGIVRGVNVQVVNVRGVIVRGVNVRPPYYNNDDYVKIDMIDLFSEYSVRIGNKISLPYNRLLRLEDTGAKTLNPIVHGVSRVALKHGGGKFTPLVKIPTTKAFDFKFGTHTH